MQRAVLVEALEPEKRFTETAENRTSGRCAGKMLAPDQQPDEESRNGGLLHVMVSSVGIRLKVQPDPRDDLGDALRTGNCALAIEILLMEHGDYIYGYCRRFLGNSAEAEDVTQTVFAQALQDLKHLASAHTAGAWLRGIARHRCIDHLRARQRAFEVASSKDLCPQVDHPLGIVQSESDPRIAMALDECLDCLDARSREVLVLRFHDELSFHEISKLTSDAPGTLRVRLSRALAALRRCLESKGVRP